jgi:hypothetical protein
MKLHNKLFDLKVLYSTEITKIHKKRFNSHLSHHKNPLISKLLSITIPDNLKKEKI